MSNAAEEMDRTAARKASLRSAIGSIRRGEYTRERAKFVFGQDMEPCPKCGSYNMKPQMPIAMETTGDETAPQLVGKWARATKAGATPLQGPAYYACWDCFHKGPAVDCTGRTLEDCHADRALNAEMKRLWNEQMPNT